MPRREGAGPQRPVLRGGGGRVLSPQPPAEPPGEAPGSGCLREPLLSYGCRFFSKQRAVWAVSSRVSLGGGASRGAGRVAQVVGLSAS